MAVTVLFEMIKSVGDIAIISLFFSCYLSGYTLRYWKRNQGQLFASVLAVVLSYSLRNVLPEFLDFGSSYMLINISTYLLLMYSVGFFFSGKSTTKLLLIFLSMILSLLFEFLLYLLIMVLFHINYFVSGEIAFSYGGIFASQFCQFTAIFLLKKKRGKQLAFQSGNYFYLLQTAVPLISAAFFVVYPIFIKRDSASADFRYFMMILLFAAINLVHYLVFEWHQKVVQENHANQLLAQEYTHREEYYRQMEQHQIEIRRIRHDIKNQLLAIGTGNEAAEVQVDAILQEVLAEEQTLFTENEGINILLRTKHQRAQENQIRCDFDVKLPKNISFEAKDLGALIGNAVDNAIEACQKCETDRWINLRLVYFNQLLVMEIENSTNGCVKDLKTRKKLSHEHGFGTKSIRSITEKYNGDLSYDFSENKFKLAVSIWASM